MKLVDMIKEEQNMSITTEFIKNGFKDEWNEYCPMSRFYTKNIENNKILYVRRDYDKYRKHSVFKFESWIRGNNKNILDKDVDSNKKRYISIKDIESLLSFIRQ